MIFHYLSYCRWIFIAWAMYLIVEMFSHPNQNALSNAGLAVFLAGLFLGFLGFSDIEKLSRKDKKEFANPKGMKINSIVMLSLSALTFIMASII